MDTVDRTQVGESLPRPDNRKQRRRAEIFMIVDQSSILDCDAERAWDEVQTSQLLKEVARPLVAIRPAPGEELPAVWPAGATVRVRSYLFGVIPLGTRAVHFKKVDAADREIQTQEKDLIVRSWCHTISIRPLSGSRCLYRDRVDIHAGPLTPIVWLFAQWFYWHRQRRWIAVARRLQAGEPT